MKKLNLNRIFSIGVFTLWTFHAVSQDNTNPIDTLKIEEIVVTGTPVKVNRNNVPMSVSVLRSSQIQESDASALLPMLSGRIPGLFVTERGITGFGVSTGSAGQITIRGIGGNPTTGVLMLIDGHPQFMGIMGHPLPDSYVASDVQQVEVIRGPGSVLYGTNAMGGVINIITRKQSQDGLHGSGRLMYGSFNTQKYMGSVGFRKDKLSLFASINHDQTDGHRDNSDFDITNGYLKAGYELSEHLKATADFNLARFKSSDPGPDTLNAKAGYELDITRGYWAASLENEFEKLSGTFRFYYNFGEHDVTDGFHSTDKNYGINLFQSLKLLKGNTITMGFDYANYGGMAENKLAMNGAGMVFADTTVYELGVYGFVQQELFKKLNLSGGLRYQEHRTYGKMWIPSLGFALQIDKNTTWKGNFGKGFRSPTMRELFLWGPNPDLQPETIKNYETSLSRTFLDQTINLELTGFILKGNNLIQSVPGKGYQNSGKVDNKGIEISGEWKANDHLEFNLSYSYIHMETPLYATPKQQVFVSARYKTGKLLLNGGMQVVNKLDTDVSSAVALQSYVLLNAKASYPVGKYLQVFISGENLLNEHYETNRYYTMPGTTAYAGINLRF